MYVYLPTNVCMCVCTYLSTYRGLPGGSVVKNLPANAGDGRDAGLILGWGGSPGVGNGNPLQYSCLKIFLGREAWWAKVLGVTKSWTWLTHIHWRRQWYPLQYSCLENPMDGGAWWAAVHEVAESQTRLSDFTFTFHFHALEKEMATHSSILAWRIPGTGEPGGLPSMGSQSRTRLKRFSSSSSNTHSHIYLPVYLILGIGITPTFWVASSCEYL